MGTPGASNSLRPVRSLPGPGIAGAPAPANKERGGISHKESASRETPRSRG